MDQYVVVTTARSGVYGPIQSSEAAQKLCKLLKQRRPETEPSVTVLSDATDLALYLTGD